MDIAGLTQLVAAVGGALGALAAGFYGIYRLMRKSGLVGRSEDRKDKAEGTIYGDYERLLGMNRKELDRMQGELERLGRLTTSQLTMLAEQQQTLNIMKREHQIARESNADFRRKLAEVKEYQTHMVESGEISRPFMDIPTKFLKDGEGG